ncbi:MAG: helix-turn-helix domain-containing protein [Planctomycetota bacterium]|nr:helix-turn-helix domain-containing protein [Planctomycetota bacterium]
MANVLKTEKRLLVLRLLCEGSSIRSIARVTGVSKGTIIRYLQLFGNACKDFLDDRLQGLNLRHVEVDEVWTFCGKKQARLTVDEKAERSDIGDIYLWTCLDADTKLLATYAVGKRSADMARRLMTDLASRMNRPKPHASDDHAYQTGQYTITTRISTDGFAGYPEAVDLAFGPYAEYGQLIKQYRNAGMAYDPSEMVGTKRTVIKGKFNAREICTSHVERNNGTIRHLVKRFTRLTCAFSKKFDCLAAAVGMFAAYYNFCWRTRHSDDSGQAGRQRVTAAMAAKVTDRLWSFQDLYNAVIQYG